MSSFQCSQEKWRNEIVQCLQKTSREWNSVDNDLVASIIIDEVVNTDSQNQLVILCGQLYMADCLDEGNTPKPYRRLEVLKALMLECRWVADFSTNHMFSHATHTFTERKGLVTLQLKKLLSRNTIIKQRS